MCAQSTSALSNSRKSSISDPADETPCPICKGYGWLSSWVNNKYQSVECECHRVVRLQRELDRLMAQSGLPRASIERWSLDRFDPQALRGPEEVRAHVAHIKEWLATWGEEPKGWVVLCGPTGVGKTHLAYGTALVALRHHIATFATTAPDLLDLLRSGFKDHTSQERFDALRTAPLLVLDDLGAENATPWAGEKLFQLVDYRYRESLPMLVTTNLDLRQGRAHSLNPRLVSRLTDGMNRKDGLSYVITLDAKDYRRREE